MIKRIVTAFALAAVIFPLIILGGVYFHGLMAVAAVYGAYEIVSVASKGKFQIHAYILSAIFLTVSVLLDPTLYFVNTVYIVLYLIGILLLPIFDKNFSVDKGIYIFTLTTLVALGMHAMTYIRLEMSVQHFFVIIFATSGSDVGAYFTGYFLGKRKLIPRISPKKTVEGAIGGVILGTVAGIVLAMILGLMNEATFIIVSCFVLSITSEFGDLIFSSLKRHFDVKDFSNIFPGHGGVLDRIDSIIFSSLVYILIAMAMLG